MAAPLLSSKEQRQAIREAILVRATRRALGCCWRPPAVAHSGNARPDRARPGWHEPGFRQGGPTASRPLLLAPPQAVYASTHMAVSWSPGREVLLGVLSSDARVAVRALRDWCQALGLPYVVPQCKVRRRAAPGWAGRPALGPGRGEGVGGCGAAAGAAAGAALPRPAKQRGAMPLRLGRRPGRCLCRRR
jgi:hypothetical protein